MEKHNCSVVSELLKGSSNYEEWRIQVRTWLLARDLWTDVVEKDGCSAQQNAAALHAIFVACDPSTSLQVIKKIDSAKLAWAILEQNYSDNEGSSEASGSETQDFELYKTQLFDPVYRGDWETARMFLDQHPEAVRARVPHCTGTVLHVAVTQGHLHIVKELVDRMEETDLEIERDDGLTPLATAVEIGNMPIARCLISKNEKLTTIRLRGHSIPVRQAALFGQWHMVPYLYAFTPQEYLTSEDGGTHGADLISLCIYTHHFDIALHLLDKAPLLAVTGESNPNGSPVYALALGHRAFIGSSKFWQRLMSNYEKIEARDQYHVLMSRVCKIVEGISNGDQLKDGGIDDSLIAAAAEGNVKFITSMANANPNLVWNFHIALRVFAIAIKYRQAEVFSLIYGLSYRKTIASFLDKKENTLLHKAASIAPLRRLNLIPGAALQMQRELQWYKEVESMTSHPDRELKNEKKLTARDLFTESHKDLVIAGEKWMKDTASSSTVVGALIVTVTFAATVIFPGGNDQLTGFPMFLHRKYFKVFMISNAVALFSSTTSVLVFLGILTSRYAEEDFLKSLPTKLVIGLSTLFLSIAAIIIAFCARIALVKEKWIIVPSVCLACIPVLLYMWMQFPLLVDIAMSTYGPSIFNRNVQRWI